LVWRSFPLGCSQEATDRFDHRLRINRMRDELSFATHMLFILRAPHEHDPYIAPNVVANHARKRSPVELALSEIHPGHQHADAGVSLYRVQGFERVRKSGCLVSSRLDGLEKHFSGDMFLMDYQHWYRHDAPCRFLRDPKSHLSGVLSLLQVNAKPSDHRHLLMP
jgi:hypothetical protein